MTEGHPITYDTDISTSCDLMKLTIEYVVQIEEKYSSEKKKRVSIS